MVITELIDKPDKNVSNYIEEFDGAKTPPIEDYVKTFGELPHTLTLTPHSFTE